MDQSAAMEAGIKANDIIIAINNVPTHNTAQLQGEISKVPSGETKSHSNMCVTTKLRQPL